MWQRWWSWPLTGRTYRPPPGCATSSPWRRSRASPPLWRACGCTCCGRHRYPSNAATSSSTRRSAIACDDGQPFHDLDDVRYLLRYLNITGVEEALEVVTRYFDAERLPPKTRLALEELLPG